MDPDNIKTKRGEAIISYIDNNVLSRTLQTDPLIYRLEDGRLEGVYSDRIIFGNTARTKEGFSFDMFVISDEKVYALDDKERRCELQRDFSGISLFRYSLSFRHSTNEYTGFMQMISTTVKGQTAEGVVSSVFNLRLDEDKKRLSWEEEQMLYRDQAGQNGGFVPVAFEAGISFYFEGEKICFEYDGRSLEVNPGDLTRKPSKAFFPKFIAREITKS